MADKRGKDYNKRLTLDEVTEKLSKDKKIRDVPYRTATIIRNSNQMQNLLQNMNLLDMEEHQQKLQNEQVKQVAVGELLSREPQIELPKKQMKHKGVDATVQLKGRFTQAGVKTLSTGSDAVEPVVIHNSAQTEEESEVLQDQMDDAVTVLNREAQDQQQSAISQQQTSGNLASTIAKKGKRVALKAGKSIGSAAATTALIGQGLPPEFAALGGSAAGAAIEAGYTFAFGGGQSSSSGMQPMESENVQQKRSHLGETGGPETQKRGRKKHGDEVVLVEGGKAKAKAKAKAKTKAETKAEKKEEREAEAFKQPETDAPLPKAKNIPVKKQTITKTKREHGTEMVTGKSEAWWNRQNEGFLKNQAELRGKKYSDLETKGYKIIDPDDPKHKKKIWKEKPYRRADYLRILKEILKEKGEL